MTCKYNRVTKKKLIASSGKYFNATHANQNVSHKLNFCLIFHPVDVSSDLAELTRLVFSIPFSVPFSSYKF